VELLLKIKYSTLENKYEDLNIGTKNYFFYILLYYHTLFRWLNYSYEQTPNIVLEFLFTRSQAPTLQGLMYFSALEYGNHKQDHGKAHLSKIFEIWMVYCIQVM